MAQVENTPFEMVLKKHGNMCRILVITPILKSLMTQQRLKYMVNNLSTNIINI